MPHTVWLRLFLIFVSVTGIVERKFHINSTFCATAVDIDNRGLAILTEIGETKVVWFFELLTQMHRLHRTSTENLKDI